MSYEQALEQLHQLHRFGVKPGLERIRELLHRLGNPHIGSTRFVHIAGTNGKGSTASFVSNILYAAGHRCGLFTSPHLHHHCERYRIDGRQMSEPQFAELFSQVLTAIDAMCADGWESPTEFEAVTALALLWFAHEQVEWAVMECGLGGRYDSTNVIEPDLVIITNVAMDHMDYLGTDVTAIAAEKAGIIKHGCTVITAAIEPALSVIERCAREQKAVLLLAGRDFQAQWPGELSLLGEHQRSNAALAAQAARQLGVAEDVIAAALQATQWPGRLEVWSRQPLIIFDGAHNVAGMEALADALQQYWPDKRICAVLGMLADKQREQALSCVLPYLQQVIVTPPPVISRSGDWQQIALWCEQAGCVTITEEDNSRAWQKGLSVLEQGDCDMLLVCGSLYLIASLREQALLMKEEGAVR